jgi:hypothetical protein
MITSCVDDGVNNALVRLGKQYFALGLYYALTIIFHMISSVTVKYKDTSNSWQALGRSAYLIIIVKPDEASKVRRSAHVFNNIAESGS